MFCFACLVIGLPGAACGLIFDAEHRWIWGLDSGRMSLHPFEDPTDALAAYSAGELKRYYVEPLAVGDALAGMPLFLTADVYVPVPLEATYLAA